MNRNITIDSRIFNTYYILTSLIVNINYAYGLKKDACIRSPKNTKTNEPIYNPSESSIRTVLNRLCENGQVKPVKSPIENNSLRQCNYYAITSKGKDYLATLTISFDERRLIKYMFGKDLENYFDKKTNILHIKDIKIDEVINENKDISLINNENILTDNKENFLKKDNYQNEYQNTIPSTTSLSKIKDENISGSIDNNKTLSNIDNKTYSNFINFIMEGEVSSNEKEKTIQEHNIDNDYLQNTQSPIPLTDINKNKVEENNFDSIDKDILLKELSTDSQSTKNYFKNTLGNNNFNITENEKYNLHIFSDVITEDFCVKNDDIEKNTDNIINVDNVIVEEDILNNDNNNNNNNDDIKENYFNIEDTKIEDTKKEINTEELQTSAIINDKENIGENNITNHCNKIIIKRNFNNNYTINTLKNKYYNINLLNLINSLIFSIIILSLECLSYFVFKYKNILYYTIVSSVAILQFAYFLLKFKYNGKLKHLKEDNNKLHKKFILNIIIFSILSIVFIGIYVVIANKEIEIVPIITILVLMIIPFINKFIIYLMTNFCEGEKNEC